MTSRHFQPLFRRLLTGVATAGLMLALAAPACSRAQDAADESTPAAAPAEPAVAPAPEMPAAESTPAEPTQPVQQPEAVAVVASPVPPAPPPPPAPVWIDRGEVVVIGNNVVLQENERASEVVVIGGNAEIRGRVDGEVVTIFGNSRINGRIGEAVVVLGSLSLDEQAQVDGDAVAVLGRLDNPHKVRIRGDTVAIGGIIPHPGYGAMLAWLADTTSMSRVLSPHIAWPWIFFAVGTAILFLLVVVFGRAANACARTLEERPAQTMVTALALLPGLPLFTLLLICTVLGILLLPFLAVAVMFAVAFGKAAVLVFLGRAVLRLAKSPEMADHAWLSFLIGTLILAALYCVPFFGVFVWALTGWIGFGMVVATLVEKRRAEKAKAAAARPVSPVSPRAPVASAAPAPTVAPAAVAKNPFVIAPMPVVPPSGPASAEPPPDAVPGANPVEPPLLASAAPTNAGSAATAGFIPPPPPPAPAAAPIAPVPSSALLPRAEFGIRLAALLVDVVLVVVGGSVTMIFGAIPFPLLFGAYAFGFWLWKGTTIGGIVFNLKVVRLDDRPVDAASSLVRTLVAFLSAVTLLGFLWCIWDDERQTWHDKVAGTTVVRVPKTISLV